MSHPESEHTYPYTVSGATIMSYFARSAEARGSVADRLEVNISNALGNFGKAYTQARNDEVISKFVLNGAYKIGLGVRIYGSSVPFVLEEAPVNDKYGAVENAMFGLLESMKKSRRIFITDEGVLQVSDGEWAIILDKGEGYAKKLARQQRRMRSKYIVDKKGRSDYKPLPPLIASPELERRVHAGIDVVGNFICEALRSGN